MTQNTDRITRTPGVRSGQPCIRGTRLTVADILSYLASGMTVEEVLADFPKLARADVLTALAYAAEPIQARGGAANQPSKKK